MYKIFFNHRILGVCSDWSLCRSRPDAIAHKVTNNFGIAQLVAQFRQNEAMKELWLLTGNPDGVMRDVSSCFEVVEAAGGFVRNAAGDVLLIFRYGHWDLPKGKREAGETIERNAMREVEEECGVGKLTLLSRLGTTYHVYDGGGAACLKHTHWFTMRCDDDAPPVPQTSEDIQQALWVPVDALPAYLPQMFASIADLLCCVVV
ncbi:MAG: NUDIX domain-containing protein [Prevotellaceae bacterium]|jgi:8-oxo-dGTP pyrophosphatase MutT (NUDIX family)|nr:NUDIX domain-containing protein [Prevotellaceae bacterium]